MMVDLNAERLRERMLKFRGEAGESLPFGIGQVADVDMMRIAFERDQILSSVKSVFTNCNEPLTWQNVVNISFNFPRMCNDHYYVELLHSLTLHKVGAVSGFKVREQPACQEDDKCVLLEYGCAVVSSSHQLVIEYVRTTDLPDTISVAVDGHIAWRLQGHVCRKWGLYPVDVPQEICIDGEMYGRIVDKSRWNSIEVAIVRTDGSLLPVPLRFGHSSIDIMKVFLRLITLAPLWSRSRVVNRDRVIDPSTAETLNDSDLVVYFVTCLYLATSVYGCLVLSDAD